jgi:hypothetical protein
VTEGGSVFDDYSDQWERTGTAYSRWAGDFGTRLTNSLVSGVGTQMVRRRVYGNGELDYGQIAGDAFGNTLGNSLTEQLAREEAQGTVNAATGAYGGEVSQTGSGSPGTPAPSNGGADVQVFPIVDRSGEIEVRVFPYVDPGAGLVARPLYEPSGEIRATPDPSVSGLLQGFADSLDYTWNAAPGTPTGFRLARSYDALTSLMGGMVNLGESWLADKAVESGSPLLQYAAVGAIGVTELLAPTALHEAIPVGKLGRAFKAEERLGEWAAREGRADDIGQYARLKDQLRAQEVGIPFGFRQASEVQSFGDSLYGGLSIAGFRNVDAAFQGSSVTGRAFRPPYEPFDVGRVSDFDIALASTELFEKAQAVGIGLRGQGTRTDPLSLARTPELLERMGLTQLSTQLSQQAGRPVNFMIYRSIEEAIARSPSIVVPRAR